jgi:hypothetical protein
MTNNLPRGTRHGPALVESNLAWKDTVLVRSGETVDILLDVSNPGLWMAHCHIAEHNRAARCSASACTKPDRREAAPAWSPGRIVHLPR